MSGSNNLDQTRSQVLPGGATNTFEGIATNFGLSSSAFAVLNDALKNSRGIGLSNVSDLSPENIRALFEGINQVQGNWVKQRQKGKDVDVFVPGNLNTKSGTFANTPTLPFVFSFQNLGSEFPGPAKFYTKNIASDRWVLPVPPANFSVSVPNSQQIVNTVHGFQYTHAGNIELDEISFEGFFPFVDPTEPTPDFIPEYISVGNNTAGAYNYRIPRQWVENLVTAMRANQPLIFSVHASTSQNAAAMTDTGLIIEPTAMSVASFSWDMGTSVGGSRRDVNYSITLKRWRRQSICITNYVAQPSIAKNYNLSPGPAGVNYNKITLNKPTSLMVLARDLLHDVKRWKDIYDINKGVLTKLGFNSRTKAGSRPIPNKYKGGKSVTLRIPKK